MSTAWYQPAHERIVSEHFEGEVVVVNLDNGAYYSLRGSAEAIWKWVAAGVAMDSIVARFVAGGAAEAVVRTELANFVGSLMEEGLLIAASTGSADASGETGAYETPLLEKFTDMQDLLLLDPIHDVDEAGWPRQLTETAAEAPKAE